MDSLSSSVLSSYYHLIFTAFVFLILALIFIFTRKFTAKKLNLLPVVGNLSRLRALGPFFQYVRELIPKYDSILMLKMGTRTMIIISSAKLAYEALIEKGQIFASRLRRTRRGPSLVATSSPLMPPSTAPCGGTWCRTHSAPPGSGSSAEHRRWRWINLLIGSRRRRWPGSFGWSRTPNSPCFSYSQPCVSAWK
ncbi:UNVERIFIED_CONTAM: cytochrome [Sesamum calycinum]|uniref:Cytochrome n=1 Tax=Sesamum calycinum TaxID=2727403 RepID=A0AAW2SF14_9LAMI